jgi:toxin ParE1/3/4
MKLVIARSAWERLDRLQKYWADFNSDEKVQARLDELLDEAVWLSNWPGAGAQEIFMEHRGKHYRRWPVGKIKIVYYIAGEELRVSDFFDGRQDPQRMQG